ncbi:MAG: undecaprenyl-diphosphatase [Nocardioidaceae bacterium]|jgi:undecaprenyl-diphosphatase|nr:undecaprenyl-diphosphatase [Nocardioidaceae bacterium]
MDKLSYLQAVVIGLLQGGTELFPVSSLGHSVIVPALIGGSWNNLVTQSSTQNSEQSPYLAFIVALHVATAIALLIFFWRDWVRIISAFFRSCRRRRVENSDERLAWLIVVATIPVGITGLLLEHVFRTLFAKPLAASIFLFINGFILLTGERLRRNAETRETRDSIAAVDGADSTGAADTGRLVVAERRTLADLAYREAAVIGFFQTFALLAGISRSGITMVAGLLRGLDHEDAARFSFLLATPVIFAAGLLKLPVLAGPAGDGIRGQVLVGSVVAGIAAYLSVRFLVKYFQTRTLQPFAIYCLVVGALCTVRFAIG